MRIVALATAIMLSGAASKSLACLWDYDSLNMERQKFPEAHELIAGHFVRHSPAYYEWRIQDRTKKPPEQRSPADFDDLAVAYEKLDRHDEAIAVIREKIERWPNEGRYESEANLGTFLIHAGRLEEGLKHIQRAIKINSDAHFGREVYQQLLVEYVIEQGDGLPLRNDEEPSGFAEFVIKRQIGAEGAPSAESAEIARAVKGVLGMMRFGSHDSPVLLEALGDLLIYDWREDAKQLAARAYLKASYEAAAPDAAQAYRELAKQALLTQVGIDLDDVEEDLLAEIDDADGFYRQIVPDEREWIAAGENVDQRFAAKYYSAPRMRLSWPNWRPLSLHTKVKIVLFVALAAIASLVFWTVKTIRRRRKSARRLSAA